MDGFSVLELRNASLSLKGTPSDLIEARKIIYRQILRFKANDWLYSEGKNRTKRYYVTEKFKALTAELNSKKQTSCIDDTHTPNYSVLNDERSQYQGELEITLGEIDEYKSLVTRFPELQATLNYQLSTARLRSAKLLGKVNALNKVLISIKLKQSTC